MPKELCLEKFLDRDEVQKWISDHYSESLHLLRDLVHYGTGLMPRAFESSGKLSCDVLALFVLLKQVVAMLDAVEVLVSSGAVLAAHLQARAIMEASLYLDWMLVSDTEKKAKHFYVADLRSEKSDGTRVLGNDEAFNKLMNKMQLEPFDPDECPDSSREGVAKRIEMIDAILADPEYADVNRAFEFKNNREPRKREPYWYVPCGAGSIRVLVLGQMPTLSHTSCL